mmetsp:Transcript_63302/g.188518  ORF Transcript_63302/g.188518 Transcript_63302/m.188518 type:complete len:220 (+) Transcript_63302:315-974(+)
MHAMLFALFHSRDEFLNPPTGAVEHCNVIRWQVAQHALIEEVPFASASVDAFTPYSVGAFARVSACARSRALLAPLGLVLCLERFEQPAPELGELCVLGEREVDALRPPDVFDLVCARPRQDAADARKVVGVQSRRQLGANQPRCPVNVDVLVDDCQIRLPAPGQAAERHVDESILLDTSVPDGPRVLHVSAHHREEYLVQRAQGCIVVDRQAHQRLWC